VTICHVVAVLEDDERRMWGVLECAVALADEERARLTLAKTTDPGWIMRCFAPAALQSMCVSAEDLDFRTIAGHKLSRAAEFVPAHIPITTLLLAQNTTAALTALLRGGAYHALVATDALIAHRRRLRRELRRTAVRTIVTSRRPSSPGGEASPFHAIGAIP
jgi:hypothetical protein